MRIAGLQLDIAWESPAENHAKLRPWIRTAVAAGARLLVLPEMYAGGFNGLWVGGSVPARPEEAERPVLRDRR